MANEEHLAILKQGVEAWNQWREQSKETSDLTGAQLSGAYLEGVNFRGACLHRVNLSNAGLKAAVIFDANLQDSDFCGADLSAATLGNAYLYGANLSGANLRDAGLDFAHLTNMDLRSASLCGASLIGTKLSMAALSSADFGGANLGYTVFAHCDMSEIKGLDLARHAAPSTIGLDTIYKSKGKISESFLRGCGVPESFITQMHALVGAEDGIQYYSCFLSHSTRDKEFADRLYGQMQQAKLRVWFAPEDMKSGAKLHEQIETAIRVYDKLLIVLSEASLQSEWVKTELRKAFKAERREGRRKLFPVRLVDIETIQAWECFDADSGKDLATELREYFIPDFSDWKNHDAFEAAFARLLKDLRDDGRAK